jgi:hypothetical protein
MFPHWEQAEFGILFARQNARESAMNDMKIFIPITKIDAARRLVYGVVTAETPDVTGEVRDYASTKRLYQRSRGRNRRAIDGVLRLRRAQHGPGAGQVETAHGTAARQSCA